MSRYQPQTDALRQHLKEIGDYPEGELEGLIKAATPHLIVAYKEGRMKATAGIGRRLVQKNLELSRKLRLVRQGLEGTATDAELLAVLGEDEGPTTAEQEVRAKALEEAADLFESACPDGPGPVHFQLCQCTAASELRCMARPAVRQDGKYGRPDCPVGGHAFPEVVCDDRCQVQADALDKLRASLGKEGL